MRAFIDLKLREGGLSHLAGLMTSVMSHLYSCIIFMVTQAERAALAEQLAELRRLQDEQKAAMAAKEEALRLEMAELQVNTGTDYHWKKNLFSPISGSVLVLI